jgi:HlyD family secretion protein
MKIRMQWSVSALFLLGACAEEPPPPVYQPVAVARRDIVVSASAAGSIEPVTTVEVKSKASGEILQVNAETGDVVRAGQLLVRVDPRTPRNALTQAEADLEVAQAQLDNARSQLRRSEELYKTQSITEQEFEAARLQAANANASLVRARRNLDDANIAFEDTEVKAPTTGVIIQRSVEPGTVISSAISQVSGGTVLLRMANLDTVQVRTLVDETDIGKIRAGLDVTITVDAFPNRPFRGSVLKIEPQASVQQNVTMFPVLIRIANENTLLKPGMNAEVEIHVGARQGVLAIPNAALRTQRDVGSAASVLGLDSAQVRQQVAEARQRPSQPDSASRALAGGASRPADNGERKSAGDTARGGGEKFTMPDGREITLPPGLKAAQVRAVFAKMQSGGGFASLSAEDQVVMQQLRSAGGMGGRRAGGGGSFVMRGGEGAEGGEARMQRPAGSSGSDYLFGGDYIVFVMRAGRAEPAPIRTGLTDLDYSEVVSGLTEQDTVLILPSASLIRAQQQEAARSEFMRSNALPGVQRQTTQPAPGPGPMIIRP